jgi:hypothetical protein
VTVRDLTIPPTYKPPFRDDSGWGFVEQWAAHLIDTIGDLYDALETEYAGKSSRAEIEKLWQPSIDLVMHAETDRDFAGEILRELLNIAVDENKDDDEDEEDDEDDEDEDEDDMPAPPPPPASPSISRAPKRKREFFLLRLVTFA